MIEGDIESALAALVVAGISDTDCPVYVGERNDVAKKKKRIVVHASDALSLNASITNVFELTVAVVLRYDPKLDDSEDAIDALAQEIGAVVSSVSLKADMNAIIKQNTLESFTLSGATGGDANHVNGDYKYSASNSPSMALSGRVYYETDGTGDFVKLAEEVGDPDSPWWRVYKADESTNRKVSETTLDQEGMSNSDGVQVAVVFTNGVYEPYGTVIATRLYDLRREVVDGYWIRTSNIRFVVATS